MSLCGDLIFPVFVLPLKILDADFHKRRSGESAVYIYEENTRMNINIVSGKSAFIFTMLILISSGVLANDVTFINDKANPGLDSVIPRSTAEVLKPEPDIKLASDAWVFLGCFSTHHLCHHEATKHGYHHATVRFNERACHHEPHQACYAK